MTKNKQNTSVIGWFRWVCGSYTNPFSNIKNKIQEQVVKDYKKHGNEMAASFIALVGCIFMLMSLLWIIPVAIITNSANVTFVAFLFSAVFGFWYPWYLLYVGLHSDE